MYVIAVSGKDASNTDDDAKPKRKRKETKIMEKKSRAFFKWIQKYLTASFFCFLFVNFIL